MSPHNMAEPSAKHDLRRSALSRRDALAPQVRARASLAIAEEALRLPELSGVAPVGAYWPMRSEVDCQPLIRGLAERGQNLALPVIADSTLVFRAWRPGDPLEDGPFGTKAPFRDAPGLEPRVLLVPLAAFDRALHRIGYGKGFYDRAIADLRARKGGRTIGLAFACQEVACVPVESHDRRLDVIVTEVETILVR